MRVNSVAGPGFGRRIRWLAGTATVGLLLSLSTAAPVHATKVCIQYLDGYRCEIFREPTPTAPGNTRGMSMSIRPDVLTGANELRVSAGRFTKGEVVRAWVFNIFGQQRMSALTNVYEANGKGRVSFTYAPSTALYESSWGQPYICMRGERSLRLACAPFSVATDTAAEPTPAPTSTPTPSPSPSGSLAPGCIDAGFTIICTS